MENERLGTTIATGLCEVADALPRTELALELYPTETMREAAVKLYTLILRFLTRALKWYEEGRLRHAMHAVFKPAALQYDDILAEIRQVSRSISDRAMASGQAEQRDMHNKLRNVESVATVEFNEIQSRQSETHSKLESFEHHTSSALARIEGQHNADVLALTALINDLRETILTSQAAHASERMQLKNALCDLQLSQLLGALSSSLAFNHLETLHQVRKLRGRRPGQGSRGAMRLQTYPAFNDWSTSSAASILRMRSTFKDRNSLQDAITQIIEYLRQAKVGVLWALRNGYQTYEMSEVLKSLVYQALAVYHSTDTDAAASLKSRKAFSACFEEDYVELLDDVLQSFRLVYIIVESPVVSSEASARFQKHLGDLVERSRLRAPMGRLKVLVVNYGPVTAISPGEDVVLKLERLKRSKGRQTKSKAALGYKGRRSGRMSGADDGIRLD